MELKPTIGKIAVSILGGLILVYLYAFYGGKCSPDGLCVIYDISFSLLIIFFLSFLGVYLIWSLVTKK